jgi:hypothetical protein
MMLACEYLALPPPISLPAAPVNTSLFPSFILYSFSPELGTKLLLRDSLKGPKREMFVAGIFTEIRPVWVGDLETMPKNLKSLCLGPYITLCFLGFLLKHCKLQRSKIKKWGARSKKKLIWIASMFTC